jgi:exodeoxyribonuclease VII large subunit
MDQHIYTVAEITREIKLLLEDTLPTIWVQGEVSNFKHHYSGHYYFTLKDESAQLSAVMWSSRARLLNFELADGLLVQALGNIRLYEKTGRYQLDIIRMQPAGVGDLQMAFEQLKSRLQQEGLFDQEYKKPLPPYPETVGIVTSETGAAIRDIINVVSRRAPGVRIIVRPVKVQGDGAAGEIAQAVAEFNEYGQADLLIVGRGGGSLEDLWAFNEEIVARALHASVIPVISAVGHEIDFTIADFVADMRAPTPSAAAEIAVPDQMELKSDLFESFRRMQFLLNARLQYLRERIDVLSRSYGLRKPEDLVRQYAQQVDELAVRLNRNSMLLHEKMTEKVRNLSLRLDNMSPKNVLRRGYSITYQNGKVVSDIHRIDKSEEMETELANGRIRSTIITTVGEKGNG